MTSRRRIVALVVAVTTLAACTPGWLTQTTLTANGSAVYDISGDRSLLTVTAPNNIGGNHREALVAKDGPTSTDQVACATWVDGLDSPAQPGLVLRLDVAGARAVTVTKNVWGQVYSTVNVHTWTLTGPDEQRYTQVAQFPFLPALHTASGAYQQGPWRACATATGATVRVKVWPTSRPEPVYGDPCCGGSATVPVWAGRPGWYGGHLSAGESIHMSDLVAGALP